MRTVILAALTLLCLASTAWTEQPECTNAFRVDRIANSIPHDAPVVIWIEVRDLGAVESHLDSLVVVQERDSQLVLEGQTSLFATADASAHALVWTPSLPSSAGQTLDVAVNVWGAGWCMRTESFQVSVSELSTSELNPQSAADLRLTEAPVYETRYCPPGQFFELNGAPQAWLYGVGSYGIALEYTVSMDALSGLYWLVVDFEEQQSTTLDGRFWVEPFDDERCLSITYYPAFEAQTVTQTLCVRYEELVAVTPQPLDTFELLENCAPVDISPEPIDPEPRIGSGSGGCQLRASSTHGWSTLPIVLMISLLLGVLRRQGRSRRCRVDARDC